MQENAHGNTSQTHAIPTQARTCSREHVANSCNTKPSTNMLTGTRHKLSCNTNSSKNPNSSASRRITHGATLQKKKKGHVPKEEVTCHPPPCPTVQEEQPTCTVSTIGHCEARWFEPANGQIAIASNCQRRSGQPPQIRNFTKLASGRERVNYANSHSSSMPTGTPGTPAVQDTHAVQSATLLVTHRQRGSRVR
jgi:hypothetical protein